MRPAAALRVLGRRGRVARAFAPYARAHLPALAGALALGLAVALAEVLRPWPLQVVFDRVLAPVAAPRGPWWPALDALPPAALVVAAALAVVVISAAGGIAAYAQATILSNAGQRLVARIRRDLFRRLIALPLEFHHGHRHGDLLMRLTGDIVLLRELLLGGLLDASGALLVLAGTLGVMLWLEPELTLWSLAVVPAVALLGAWIGGRIRRTVRRNRDKEGALAGHAGEALSAVAVVQAFAAEGRVGERFERENRSSLRAGLKASRLEALLSRALDLLTAAGTGVTLALGAWSVQRGDLTPGGLLVFLAYQRTLYRPVRQLARLVARSAKSAACGERVLEVLEARPALAERPGAAPLPPLRGEVRFEDVGVTYPRGDVALAGVSFTVPAGATCVVRGESGAGKSTLLALLPRLLDPTAGRVLLDGADLRDATLASVRGQVAMVFQESVLFGLTVRENLALGRPDATDAEIERAAERAGALGFVRRLPHGFDTVVGERGAQLSGGQRQRLALARAALRDAPVLALDEPFAHLDDVSRAHVLESLREVARGRTVILVTHQEHPGLEADVELTLRGGRVARVATRGRADAEARADGAGLAGAAGAAGAEAAR